MNETQYTDSHTLADKLVGKRSVHVDRELPHETDSPRHVTVSVPAPAATFVEAELVAEAVLHTVHAQIGTHTLKRVHTYIQLKTARVCVSIALLTHA